MGFSVSALLAGALADHGRYAVAFTGDGSFTMNPQVLIDGVEHGRARAPSSCSTTAAWARSASCSVRSTEANFRTSDSVAVDYVQMAASVAGVKALSGGFDPSSLTAALEEAFDYDGLSLIHVPVYFGDDLRGGMGAYGRWNVGNWCDDVQDRYVRTLI